MGKKGIYAWYIARVFELERRIERQDAEISGLMERMNSLEDDYCREFRQDESRNEE